MSKLSDMKVALKQLEELGLPISNEQKRALRLAENNYVQTELIPKIKESVKNLFGEMEHKVKIIIDFDGDPTHEPNVYKEMTPVPANVFTPDLFGNTSQDKSRNTGLRVTFPNGKRLQDRGFEVLMAVVKEVGPDLVHEMDIKCCGLPLVDDHRSDGIYGKNQKPLPGGYWIITNSNTAAKKEQIETISKILDLGLKVEVLNNKGEVVESRPYTSSSHRSNRKKIKVTTPEGKVFFSNVVWETLRDVVLYAGIDRVNSLGMETVGLPLISDHVTSGIYEYAQHEIAPNVFLNTSGDTSRKVKQIKKISDVLGLGLKVELLD